MTDKNKVYLGDAVYIEPNSYGYTLTTENGISITNTIVLEPKVMSNLLGYISQQKDATWNTALENLQGVPI